MDRKQKLLQEIRDKKKELKKARQVIQLDELKARKRVLRRLGYSTPADVIETKGRVACEISTADEVLTPSRSQMENCPRKFLWEFLETFWETFRNILMLFSCMTI